jgi:folate-binding protein YgfZ
MNAESAILGPISGWVDRSNRARIEIGKSDRAKFLHNLTTNDVRRLPIGQGQESFVTNPQGKVLAYVTLLATEVSIIIRTETASLEGLAPHLAKYGVFDDVAIDDVSAGTIEIHVFGPEVESRLKALELTLPPEGPLHHSSAMMDGHPFLVIRESLAGSPGFTFVGGIEGLESLKQRFQEVGLAEVDSTTFDALRIEAGTPLSGRDVTTSNLPQEVGRDSKTINFVKGCYLGQETVARLDALGHVNRILKGLTFEGTTVVPPDGSALLSTEGKTVGAITSAAFSTALNCPVALGYVKVAQAVAGTKLIVPIEGVGEVEATVHDLPIARTN